MTLRTPNQTRRSTRTRTLALGFLSTAALAALAPATAGAASPLNCDASALRVSVLGQAAIEPVTVNRGQPACKTATGPAGVSLAALGVPLNAGILGAATFATGANDQQQALAVGGLTDFDLGALSTIPGLTLPDLTQYLPAVQTIHIDLTTLPAVQPLLGALGLPSSIDVDISGALKALLPSLTNQPLLNIAAATSYAGASCQNGRAVPYGVSQVSGVKVLGQDLGVDPTVSSALSLLDSTDIDLSKLDLSKVTLPAVITNLTGPLAPGVLTAVNAALKTAVGGLPHITIPAQVLDVSIKPSQQTNSNGVLTQDALVIDLKLLGQDILSGAIGEARVNTTGVDCTPPAQPVAETAASTAQLQCTKRKLVLTDVLPFGDRVKLQGVADKAFIGQKVAIRFEATRKIVATATVGPDGSFLTTAKIPSSKLASTNLARYRAEIGSQKSLDLKLMRRMVVTSQSAKGGKVTITGYVTRPFAKPRASILVQQRVTCTKLKTVGKITPDANGHFSVTVAAPAGADTAVYRLATKVRTNLHSTKLFPTFTLPRAVDL